MIRGGRKLWSVPVDRLTHPWYTCRYLPGGVEPALIDCGSSLGYGVLKRSLHSIGRAPYDRPFSQAQADHLLVDGDVRPTRIFARLG